MPTFKLEIDNFKYKRNDVTLLKDIKFSLNEGRCLLLRGATGSGKTTILNLINGVIPEIIPAFFDGRMLFNGQEYALATGSHPWCSAYTVMQNPFHSFAASNFKLYGKDDADSKWLLTRMEEARSFQDLSAGERQRTLLWQAFNASNDLLLLDEPLAHLDSQGVDAFRQNLIRRKERGRGITIITEHRWNNIIDLIDEELILTNGINEKECEPINFILNASDDNNRKNGFLIKMQNASLSIAGKKILQDINCEIHPGEVVGITGINGCGKTTLAKALSGQLKLVNGSMEMNKGVKCSMLGEDPKSQLLCDSVEMEVRFAADNYGMAEIFPAELIKAFGLECVNECVPLKLSHGQQERTVTAAALSGNPDLIIFDEPAQGQDNVGIKNLLRVINNLKKCGKGVVLISHYLDLINQASDRIYLIEDGKMNSVGAL